jgi:hypothetical protein
LKGNSAFDVNPLAGVSVVAILRDIVERQQRLGKGIHRLGGFHRKIFGQRGHEQFQGCQASLLLVEKGAGGPPQPHSGAHQALRVHPQRHLGKRMKPIASRGNAQIQI